MLDEEANLSKVRYLHGKHACRCGGYKREGGCALPGEVCQCALSYQHRKVLGWTDRSQQMA